MPQRYGELDFCRNARQTECGSNGRNGTNGTKGLAMFWRNLPWMLAVGLVATIVYGCAAGVDGAEPKEKLVVEFRSTGVGRTAEFTVQDDWRLELDAKDGARSVGRDLLVVDAKLPPGSLKNPRWIIGKPDSHVSVNMDRGGTYSIRVLYGQEDHRGIWRIRIWQGSGEID
jgi:hypothetical protein